MRVILVNDYEPGHGSGAEVHLLRLIDGLGLAGDAVEVFTGARRRGAGRALDLWDPLSLRRLRRLEERFRPDVVHYHNVLRELSASVFVAARLAGRLLTVHDLRLAGVPEGAMNRPSDRAPMRLAKTAKARFDRRVARHRMHAIIAPTQTTAQRLRYAGFRGIHVVPHFADPGPDLTTPQSAADVLVAGRLSPEKGVDVLILAFSQIADRHPASRLLIVGDGPERDRLEAFASQQIGERARFLGLLDEASVRNLMATEARVVAAPSLAEEGAGLTVIEGALAGRPVVASDAGSLPELVRQAGCGTVVPRGDVAALATALDALLADNVRADRLGRAGRRWAIHEWSTPVGIARTRAVYEEIRL